jgi:hypothetical protein
MVSLIFYEPKVAVSPSTIENVEKANASKLHYVF